MYALRLNDMRNPNTDILLDICLADKKKDINAFLKKERVKPYQEIGSDGKTYTKVFRKEGPLEWYNAPTDNKLSILEILSEEAFVKAKAEEYKRFLTSLPKLIVEL